MDCKYLDPDDVPVGWKNWIILLDQDIQQLVDAGLIQNFKVEQMKEKFGELRLYFDADGDADSLSKLHDLIDDYAHVTSYTCAYCGTFPAEYQTTGWIYPVCEAHNWKANRVVKVAPFNPVRKGILYNKDGKTEYERDTSSIIERYKRLQNDV